MATRQGGGHRIEDRLDRELGVAMGQLAEALGQLHHQIRSRHAAALRLTYSGLLSSLARSRAPRLVVPAVSRSFDCESRCIASCWSALSLALIDSWIERALR